MKKFIYPIIFLAGFIFAGIIFTQNNRVNKYNDVLNEELIIVNKENAYKDELIIYLFESLNLANHLMNKHNMWDIDGSDEMALYFEYEAKIDSLIDNIKIINQY